jgi:hypothetical protein
MSERGILQIAITTSVQMLFNETVTLPPLILGPERVGLGSAGCSHLIQLFFIHAL